ncbi:MAG: PatB family C-S lyase [Proteobacteria bacterium]|nr:PatB family C-S lyase [Pseudomonadota bacterium]
MNEFDNVIDRRGTGSTKWNKYRDRDVLPFWVADMDFRAPPFILDALHKRLEHGIFGYAQTPPELTEAVVQTLDAEFDWAVSPDWLVWLPGVVTGLNLACRAVGTPGDSVMMNVPVYYPFLDAPGHGGRTAIEVPSTLDHNRWVIDMQAMTAALGNRTRMFMLCNPQNPTGRIYERDELVALAQFCERHDLLICSDEIHCGLRLDADRPHIPIATLSQDIAARTITLMAPTKTYNTPGLGCAFAVIPDTSLRRRFIDARAGLVSGIGPLAYVAATAAYQDPSDWLPRLCTYLRGNRDVLAACVDSLPGVLMTHVEATYLGWIDVRQLRLVHPLEYFESFGLGFSDGAQFHGPGFIRFNFGCPRATLEEGLDRFARAVRAAQ